jgi:hypothetical protein
MRISVLLLLSLLSSGNLTLPSQQAKQQAQPKSSASISGQVTLHGAPVPGAMVIVASLLQGMRDPQAVVRTDENGRYRITGLPSGRYGIYATEPALTSLEEVVREISLEGDEVHNRVDFALVRGGVITGRVSDTDGHPIVEELIIVMALSEAGHPRPFYSNQQIMRTDDQGVYRVYGIPPGHYTISIGEGGGSPYRRLDQGQTYYPHTYHPGVSESAKAKIIELAEGVVISGIDITVGKGQQTYAASGRIIDAETDKPQPGIKLGYGGNAMSIFGKQSDENGGFRITGLMPGRYSVFAGCEGDYYSDQIEFDITDRNVNGLEIRRHRGASISGKVVIEGATDPTVLGKLRTLSVNATSKAGNTGSMVDPDGTYYFCGLRPGLVRMTISMGQQTGFWLARIERNGDDLRNGIEVSAGDHVTDVRLVVTYATGVIRGQIVTENFELPKGVRLQISGRRLGEEGQPTHLFAETDERGRFSMEGLAAGEYELSAGSGTISRGGAQAPRMTEVMQRVTVTNETEATVTLIVKLREK